MKCPCCGQASLVHDTRDLRYTFNGKSSAITNATEDFCPTCEEVVLNENKATRISSSMLDFNRHAAKTEMKA